MLEALRVSVADPDYFDSDWNPTYHCDAAPDPGPTVLSLKSSVLSYRYITDAGAVVIFS
jgi:hypothetical protein